MNSLIIPRVVAAFAFVLMIVLNVLATALPLNGIATGDISDRYDTLFAPIGFTFSIWGVIYLLLGVYTVAQLTKTNTVIEAITPWFIASSLLNSAWIVAWHYELLWLSLLIIIGLLVTLIIINKHTTAERLDWPNTLAVRLPFAIYFGWVTVATVANASALLVQWGWQGEQLWGPTGWTVLILIVAALIGSTVALLNASPAYGLVLVWAFWGILSRHLSPEEWDGAYPGVILALQILLPLLGVVVIVAGIRWLRQVPSSLETVNLWGRA